MTKINSFRGKYYFLSNMYPCKVRVAGYIFECSEAAFQACKCKEAMPQFVGLDGYAAKKLGRKVNLINNWDNLKLEYMRYVIVYKFSQNKDLAKMLIETGDAELIEENTWGDTYWGVCNGVGENHLGKLLMETRDKLINKQLSIFISNKNMQFFMHKNDGVKRLLINPVNTVGVPGAGLAKQFAQAYPEATSKYITYCKTGVLTMGKIYVKGEVCFFPTKEDWRNPSKLEYIEAGLQKLRMWIETHDVKEIIMPKIGCGLGGLDWKDVLALIEKYLTGLSANIILLIGGNK